jgi:hypothetical protein
MDGEEDVLLIQDISTRLSREFSGVTPDDTVERLVSDWYARLASGARVTAFLRVLTEHEVRLELRSLARQSRASG